MLVAISCSSIWILLVAHDSGQHMLCCKISFLSCTTVQVESLQSVVRDRRANWKQSMAALKLAKQSGARVTKTSIMLGCGEQPHEVLHAFRTLRENGMSALASAAVSVPAAFQLRTMILSMFFLFGTSGLPLCMCAQVQVE